MSGKLDYLNFLVERQCVELSYQPVVFATSAQIIGWEVFLINPYETGYIDLKLLFDIMKENSLIVKIDKTVLKRVLDILNEKKDVVENKKFFVNISPISLMSDDFVTFVTGILSTSPMITKKIVFEISLRSCENLSVDDLHYTIRVLKKQGFAFSVENIGSLGFFLDFISISKPAYVKIGREVYRDIAMDSIKSKYLHSFLEFCDDSRIKVIATMIKKMEELLSLLEIGIEYLQGYFIMPPSMELKTSVSNDIKELLIETIENQRKHYFLSTSNIHIGTLCIKVPSVEPNISCEKALEILEQNPKLHGLVVTKDSKVEGLIKREKFLLNLSTMYGFAVYSKRPVALLMDANPIVVEYSTSLHDVVKELSAREDEDIHDYIIITKNGMYEGVVTIKDLLRKSTQLEISFAKHLNPLTNLPGNLLIEKEINSALEKERDFYIFYIDIDNFKPFNDYYGFEKGDKVILHLASILKEIRMDWQEKVFVGHIGGDDFIVIVYDKAEIEKIAKKVVEEFDSSILYFYDHCDLARGYIEAKNRKGEVEKFGLMSLSVACVKVVPGMFSNVEEISNCLSEVKKLCKQKNTSCYIIWEGGT
ncbi:diguanylate cyclase/phosphodiesterase [Caldicellulosiruptor hydrothermalis 108]|uniref:Diguanylate cyclase/phosphodiesterase n=1 Tax=Caldicellulosiruptor hydrothermalis (strain DSM 18901 / VKM B-2411 / 108) TaxID=632292 RepID=E4Q966_CALH1|nr:EAL domain-containing protein [Caldicellulosiruptor hydrothermalis]ADQ08115.1 diguanylate cyclase/phosphodiesterase [Caldicellulosiruptor hydrothermalis 108]